MEIIPLLEYLIPFFAFCDSNGERDVMDLDFDKYKGDLSEPS
jgi:hypothetical protein